MKGLVTKTWVTIGESAKLVCDYDLGNYFSLKLFFIEIKPLVLEFEMWRHFDTKQKFKIIYFVPLCLIVWFTLTLNF